jgi:predicted nucleotide-binding protein
VGSHPLVRNCKIKSSKSTKAKKKKLFIGHSQTRGIASEIQLNLDDDFETQGIVKQQLSTCA